MLTLRYKQENPYQIHLLYGRVFCLKTMKKGKIHKKRILPLKFAKKLILSLIIVMIFEFSMLAAPVFASETEELSNISNLAAFNIENINSTTEKIDAGKISIVNNLPENNNWKTIRVSTRVITAYNSEVGQCDDSPCITANGFNVCEHGIEDTIAANWLKFGTKVKIPELFGDRVFIVRDRMNKKHDDKIDIWMIDKQAAKNFGKRIAQVEILEP